MLEGKKLLITGVINRESIAFEVARQAQRPARRSSSPASAAPSA
jgi:enoyl-[acyl-carrier-protein] reductase (NADH)